MSGLTRALCCGLLFVVWLTTAHSAPQKFPDVLDSAAVPSTLALKSAMLDLAVSEQQLIAVGSRGHILYSADSGKHWQQAEVPVRSDLTTVWIHSQQLAFAAGHDGVILRSKDGGQSWHKVLDGRQIGALYQQYYQQLSSLHPQQPHYLQLLQEAEALIQQGADKAWLDLLFLDENTGYVVGAFNLIMKTQDGGESWQPLSDLTANPMGYHLHGLSRMGQHLWITGEQGLVLKAPLDAAAFEVVSTPYEGSFFGVFAADSRLFIYGLRGHCLMSVDQGLNWQVLNTGTDATITSATVTSKGDLYLSSQAGELLRSQDGGQTFQLLPERTAPALALVSSHELLFVAGMRGVMAINPSSVSNE